ncbi:RagB/SusD family nutrient uptake outer membrane protein [Sphingobacterium oryzagri]|uniref:RagB/SusD family nutrient uptake outer membrane protein n=1 Tax=Sphingobacterium oryzagri TaxID=3025669 RepID=A0ABY7WG35_9SPHI|nr:RagB/SusD family nutrient uptake outer membrane protein [Sphingobacterium sp. KACC 22765]WDF68153.1 RagB/SusD family nutrient uptake outer membrane protein [Sphingobacterium sp. KACC 22765]
MKRYFIYSIVWITGIATLASCSLVRDPLEAYSDVTEGVNEAGEYVAFKDKAAVLSHRQSMYDQIRDRQEHWYLDLLLVGDAHADNAYAGTTGAEVLPFENNSIEGSNSVLGRDWGRYMEDVARANKLIVYVDSVDDNSLTTAERTLYKAEAKIFRALVYFDMVRLWGDVPLITTVARDITSENIGEVYESYFPMQSTEKEVYEQIQQDLLEALPHAPANNAQDKTRFSKSVARALLAKIYAEKPLRDYNKVIQYADELAADGFALEQDYSNLFGMNAGNTDAKMRNTSESILEGQFFAGNGNWVTWMFGRDLTNYNSNFTWAKWVTPSRDLINAFQQEGDQVRLNQSVVYYQTTWSNYYPASNYPFIYKLRSAVNSIIKYRYADILLLKAEALIQRDSPDLTAAAAIIDQVRARVNLAPLPAATRGNRAALLDALLKERRLELAFEGQRWFDLVRLDRVEPVMNAVYAKDSGRRAQVYPFTNYSYRLPIPQSILDQNPNLKQNLGY